MEKIKNILNGLRQKNSFDINDWKQAKLEIQSLITEKRIVRQEDEIQKDFLLRKKAASHKKQVQYADIIYNLNEIKEIIIHNQTASPVKVKEIEQTVITIIKELSAEYQRHALYESSVGNWKQAFIYMKKVHKVADLANNNIAAIKPSIRAHFAMAKADYMLRGNNPQLRKNLKAAALAYPGDGSLTYLYAKYEILAGNFSKANELVNKLPVNLSNKVDAIVRAILNPAKTEHKHIAYPCNFYTYHYTLLSNERINEIRPLFAMASVRDTKEGKLAVLMLDVYKSWNMALEHMHKRRYSGALQSLDAARQKIISYLLIRHENFLNINNKDIPLQRNDQRKKLDTICDKLLSASSTALPLKDTFRKRGDKLTLKELYKLDWERPAIRFTLGQNRYSLFDHPQEGDKSIIELFKLGVGNEKVQEKIDSPLLILGKIFIPMAFAECFKFTMQFDNSVAAINQVLDYHNKKHKILCGFIELPFLAIMKAQVLLEKADFQYKSNLKVEIQNNHTRLYHHLQAGYTCQGVIDCFKNEGRYIVRVANEVHLLKDKLQLFSRSAIHPFTKLYDSERSILNPVKKLQFKTVGKDMSIHGLVKNNPARLALRPGEGFPIQRNVFLGNNQSSLRESNPLVYSIIMQAKAMQLQIQGGFNYLGYREDFIPIWKFNYLVDLAGYYADNAANLQSDYLTFLQNAEREEFQEMGALQAVSAERMNLEIENTRVEYSQAEIETAKVNKELAQLQEENAKQRKSNYEQYDNVADVADLVVGAAAIASSLPAIVGAIAGGAVGTAVIPGVGTVAGAAISSIGSGASAFSTIAGLVKEGAHRDMELKNLELAAEEAKQGTIIADKQLEVAKLSLEIANLTAQAAIMRLEYAKDNADYLRNRLTNAELWFRLADCIRSIAKTYLKRANTMAFLAEQAYEAIIGKPVNVIRFDYDSYPMGEMIGAKYLKTDLDSLKYHLTTTRGELKENGLSCTISLARDFPEALRILSDIGNVILPITLEYLEQRLPGYYGLKVMSIDITPVAIIDPTKLFVNITHLGSGLIRTKTTPVNIDGSGAASEQIIENYGAQRAADGSILRDHSGNIINRWLLHSESVFPVQSLLRKSETFTITSVQKGESRLLLTPFKSDQKDFFEDYPAAAGWQIDIPSTANTIVPGSLADLIVTFNLAGYFDTDLYTAVQQELNIINSILTKVFSARNQFSDQFFNFERTGKMNFNITGNQLTINERIGELKQLGAYFMPAISETAFNRFSAASYTKIQISNNGRSRLLESPPSFLLIQTNEENNKSLTLKINLWKALNIANNDSLYVIYEGEKSIDLSTNGSVKTANLSFTRQGKQIITVRLVQNNNLSEFKLELSLSDVNPAIIPLLIWPEISYDNDSEEITVAAKVRNNDNDLIAADVPVNATIICIDNTGKEIFSQNMETLIPGVFKVSNQVLLPGEYYIFTVFRHVINIHFSAKQKIPNLTRPQNYTCTGNKLASNKGFTIADNTQNPAVITPVIANTFTNDLFQSPVYPVDMWQFDISSNNFVKTYDCNGNEITDLSIFQDVNLLLEYELMRR